MAGLAGAGRTATSNGVKSVVDSVEWARTASSAAHCTGRVDEEERDKVRNPLAISDAVRHALCSPPTHSQGTLLTLLCRLRVNLARLTLAGGQTMRKGSKNEGPRWEGASRRGGRQRAAAAGAS